MAEETNIPLPDDDQDLILAQKLGRQISLSADFSGIEDPLVDLLAIYSDSERGKISQLSTPADATWRKIHWKISDEQTGRIIPFYQTSGFKAWVAVAAIILIAFVGFYWFVQPSVQLIAQSQAVIQEVTLPDGSEIILRPYSKLFKTAERQYILEGEGFFSIEHDPEHPFSVKVTEAKITVLGTRFNASTWGDQPRVYLEEGKILFEDVSSGQTVELQPGQASTLQERQLQLIRADDVIADQYTDWLNNTLVLNNSSFQEVIQEIEQHFDIDIILSDPDFVADSINGSYRLYSVDSTLSDIGLLVNGTFRKQSGNRYIFENGE